MDLRPRASYVLEDFERTTPDEVAKVINRLKCKNSPTDIIPTTVLKRCVNVFSVALFHLINLSFESKTFPSVFKVGHVIPLLKKTDMDINDPASYRPITNLMTICKVVERIVFPAFNLTCTSRRISMRISQLIDRGIQPRLHC